MLARFIICLVPLVLAPLVMLFLGAKNGDVAIGISMILIAIGAILSATLVSRKVFQAMKEPVWAAWLLSILTFLCVFLGYAGLGLAGGCVAALTSGGLDFH